MLSRVAVAVFAVLLVAAPLAARADLTITFHGLEALQFQAGCHLISHNAAAKSSIVRCNAKDLPATGGTYTYSDAWGVPTSDTKRYGGCGVRARVRSQTATHSIYDADVTGSHNFTCTLHWQGNSDLDVRYAVR